MKWLFILLAFAIFACSGFAGKKHTDSNNAATKKMNSSFTSVAVLELFTSEGCSSCPPADRLLPQLAILDSNIIPLSFHVDYWDHLGWKDPFSNAEFSERQREYGQKFHLESIYTPQLIINGEYELVGSSRSGAEADIKKVLIAKTGIQVIIDEVKRENNKLIVSVHAKGIPIAIGMKDVNLLAAIVQKHAEMSVKAGENRGSKLAHTNVVRTFIKQSIKEKMNFEIEVPGDLENNNWQLILYTQQKNDLKITGATVYNN
jgi:hypothetical protein